MLYATSAANFAFAKVKKLWQRRNYTAKKRRKKIPLPKFFLLWQSCGSIEKNVVLQLCQSEKTLAKAKFYNKKTQ